MLDIRIVGGMVADGLCDRAYRADVGIEGGSKGMKVS